MNDITSHLFDVPRKANPAVKGVEPGRAMPIPYTNACGACSPGRQVVGERRERDQGCLNDRKAPPRAGFFVTDPRPRLEPPRGRW